MQIVIDDLFDLPCDAKRHDPGRRQQHCIAVLKRVAPEQEGRECQQHSGHEAGKKGLLANAGFALGCCFFSWPVIVFHVFPKSHGYGGP